MASTQQARKGFRSDINALRALAVLAVIAYHFDFLGAKSGFIGVDIFFVISGYLIGGQINTKIDHKTFKIIDFFASRIRRIVPALVMVCSFVYLWGWIGLLTYDYKLLVRTVLWALYFVSNIAFSGEWGYFDSGSIYKPLLHTWSLSVEAQFYFLLPLFLILFSNLKTKIRTLGTLILFGLSLGAMFFIGSKSPSTVFYSFTSRAWEFLFGCLLASWPYFNSERSLMLGSTRSIFLNFAWIALIVTCFYLPNGMMWPSIWTIIPVFLAGSIIFLGEGSRPNILISNRLVQHFGDISYSLYLWHWPLLSCLYILSGDLKLNGGIGLWLLLALTWLMAVLSWRFVERPFRINRNFWTSGKIFSLYALSLTFFTLLGIAIWVNEGVPSRLPEYLRGAEQAAEGHDEPRCWDLPRTNAPGSRNACDLGDPKVAEPSFIVWGDSHTLPLLEPLRTKIDSESRSGYLFTRSGCKPVAPDQDRKDPCDIHNEEVLALLARTPSITTVVLAIRDIDQSTIDNTLEMAGRLLDKKYTVIFLGPIPEAKRPVAKEWAAAQLFRREKIQEMTIGRDEPTRISSFNQRLENWRKATSAVKQQYPNRFRALELTENFCDQTKCWLVKDGIGILSDMDHLTPLGAQRVTIEILKLMDVNKP